MEWDCLVCTIGRRANSHVLVMINGTSICYRHIFVAQSHMSSDGKLNVRTLMMVVRAAIREGKQL